MSVKIVLSFIVGAVVNRSSRLPVTEKIAGSIPVGPALWDFEGKVLKSLCGSCLLCVLGPLLDN